MTEGFKLIVLGCSGGPRENNLSGYLLSPVHLSEWVLFDAGTLLAGIDVALQRNNLDDVSFTDPSLTPAGEMLLKHIKCYLISHAHLDHIAALVVNSQVDTPKAILGIDPTIDNLRDHIFNGRIWPNYGSEGVEPILKHYRYVRLPLHLALPIPETNMTVETYLLSHPHGYPSTAFLIRHKEEYFLYFGDTSSDSMEVEKHLARVWKRCAPLIREKKLRGMLLECSYSHREANLAAFGHLDPSLLMKELHHLEEIAETSIKGLKVVITHRKESLFVGKKMKECIEEELTEFNDLGIDFIFPSQGDRILL